MGAFSQKSNADNLYKKLTKIGMKVYIEKGKKLYHVRIGPFSSKSKAQQHQRKVEKKTGQKGIVKNLK